MFKVFQHVLPNARAWRLTADKKLREFFVGLGEASQDIRDYFDLILDDLYPQTTRALDEWDSQFGLRDTGLTEQERRDRLDASWKALGGQSPRYIQDTLQNNGFDVYIHEWWDPADQPAIGDHTCVTPRDPFTYLATGDVACGDLEAVCGEVAAECGNTLGADGYALVNLPGVTPMIPLDSTKWAYFLYIGDEIFGDVVTLPLTRKDEFEALCLKICPTQLWLGILVNYT